MQLKKKEMWKVFIPKFGTYMQRKKLQVMQVDLQML